MPRKAERRNTSTATWLCSTCCCVFQGTNLKVVVPGIREVQACNNYPTYQHHTSESALHNAAQQGCYLCKSFVEELDHCRMNKPLHKIDCARGTIWQFDPIHANSHSYPRTLGISSRELVFENPITEQWLNYLVRIVFVLCTSNVPTVGFTPKPGPRKRNCPYWRQSSLEFSPDLRSASR